MSLLARDSWEFANFNGEPWRKILKFFYKRKICKLYRKFYQIIKIITKINKNYGYNI